MLNPDDLEISELKLAALARRRSALREQYRAIREGAAALGSEGEQLRFLQQQLAALTAGAEPLHPEARWMEELIGLDRDGTLTAALAARWLPVMQREIDFGEARADHMHLFALLVDEWLRALVARGDDAPRSANEPAIAALLARWAEGGPKTDPAFLARALDELSPWAEPLRAKLAADIAEDVEDPFGTSEIVAAADALAASPYRSPHLRRLAVEVRDDPIRCAEYASALDLVLDDLDGFGWPEEGVGIRAVWARDRRRVYLDEGLLHALFLHAIGIRWTAAVHHAVGEVLLDPGQGPFARGPDEDAHLWYADREARFLFLKSALTHGERASSYLRSGEAFDGPNALEALVTTLDAQIRTERAARPDRPLSVVRGDVVALGESLSHDLVLELLAWMGVSEAWRRLFSRVLRVPVRIDGAITEAACGVFPDQPLGLLFADLILLVADWHVWRTARIRPLRLLDEFLLVHPDRAAAGRAWRAWITALDALGLAPRRGKIGSVTLGGKRGRLPRGPVRIGLVELDSDGQWQVDEAGVEKALELLRERTPADQPILESAAVYSDAVRDLIRQLCPFSGLGLPHLRAVAAAAERAHGALFDAPTRGMAAELERRAAERFGEAHAICPDVWYWPLTAGGAGLFDPWAQLAGLEAFERTHPPQTPPPPATGEAPLGAPWKSFFRHLQARRPQPRRPLSTPTLDGLVADFVRRGDELLGREESAVEPRDRLVAYWQWVVALHGPGIAERFGSFRLIETARVPLGLLLRMRDA